MIDLKELQKRVYENKVNKKFNVTDVNLEFCLAYGELSEAHSAWMNHKVDLGEEFADVVIYLLGLCEILHIDLESEVINKIAKNEKRKYKIVDGAYIKIDE